MNTELFVKKYIKFCHKQGTMMTIWLYYIRMNQILVFVGDTSLRTEVYVHANFLRDVLTITI